MTMTTGRHYLEMVLLYLNLMSSLKFIILIWQDPLTLEQFWRASPYLALSMFCLVLSKRKAFFFSVLLAFTTLRLIVASVLHPGPWIVVAMSICGLTLFFLLKLGGRLANPEEFIPPGSNERQQTLINIILIFIVGYVVFALPNKLGL